MILECRAVLFDVDGVLVDSTASGERSWTRWAREHGLDPAVVLDGVHGRRSTETVRMHLPEAQADEGLRRIDELEIGDAGTTVAIPGAAELLASVAGNWAVVTSASRPLLEARLAAAGLPLAPVVVTAADVSRGKPDPEGYLLGARRVGVPIGECAIFEDSGNGLAAAVAAGPAAVVGVGRGALDSPAAPVVQDLAGIRWTGAGLRVDAVLRA
ncbi:MULTISPECIES: HAD-IA family hydrolase [unclassified Amycolatopsis]|uniref:HAD-IA family hydrolase n=1 Tax=unclassified Amycolatopsis TaxID=2618356 RepID=UPI001C699200|nr:HAD-IA family hydrolase [Amycolatopsis sp. DSM 110486]QYN17389.1 HAD-IA family hydrolase [Amycolatopsis sp. DSM 110486]